MVSEREGRSPVIGLLSHNAPSLRARLQFDMFGLCNYCLGQPSIAFERGQSGESERTATNSHERRRGEQEGWGAWAGWLGTPMQEGSWCPALCASLPGCPSPYLVWGSVPNLGQVAKGMLKGSAHKGVFKHLLRNAGRRGCLMLTVKPSPVNPPGDFGGVRQGGKWRCAALYSLLDKTHLWSESQGRCTLEPSGRPGVVTVGLWSLSLHSALVDSEQQTCFFL